MECLSSYRGQHALRFLQSAAASQERDEQRQCGHNHKDIQSNIIMIFILGKGYQERWIRYQATK